MLGRILETSVGRNSFPYLSFYVLPCLPKLETFSAILDALHKKDNFSSHTKGKGKTQDSIVIRTSHLVGL